MEITTEELDGYLKIIFTGSKFVEVRGVDLILKHPDNKTKMKSDLVRKKSYEKAISEGLLPFKELEKIIDERNIITKEEKEELKKLESKLEGQKAILKKTEKSQVNIEKINRIIEGIESRIREIKYKKLSKMMISADIKAEEEKNLFLCLNCVFDYLTEEPYWVDYNTYSLDSNYKFKRDVLESFVDFYRGISTSIIRYIARNNLWRVRYVTSIKTSESLFGISTSEYTDDMLNLVFWSNYYQSIYEMMPEDRPNDKIIEDDDALDAFMSSYHDEKEKEMLARKGNKHAKGKGRMSAFNKEEVIVTKANELYQDMKYDKPREAQRVKDRPTVSNRKKRRRRR